MCKAERSVMGKKGRGEQALATDSESQLPVQEVGDGT